MSSFKRGVQRKRRSLPVEQSWDACGLLPGETSAVVSCCLALHHWNSCQGECLLCSVDIASLISDTNPSVVRKIPLLKGKVVADKGALAA